VPRLTEPRRVRVRVRPDRQQPHCRPGQQATPKDGHAADVMQRQDAEPLIPGAQIERGVDPPRRRLKLRSRQHHDPRPAAAATGADEQGRRGAGARGSKLAGTRCPERGDRTCAPLPLRAYTGGEFRHLHLRQFACDRQQTGADAREGELQQDELKRVMRRAKQDIARANAGLLERPDAALDLAQRVGPRPDSIALCQGDGIGSPMQRHCRFNALGAGGNLVHGRSMERKSLSQRNQTRLSA
jgi:hypothetical protein